MNVNTVHFEEDKTCCIVNIGVAPPLYNPHNFSKMFTFLSKVTGSKKEYFKKVFGKQLTCRMYTNRNWIWTFSDENNTACVNALISTTGISWEFRKDSNIKNLKSIILEIENMLLENKNG
jgi:hypothetical protein